jgi:sensor histidine kinase YesM
MGLNIFNNENNKYQFIDEEQGFIDKQFTSSKIVNDNLIIGTNSGYYSVNLKHLIQTKTVDLKPKLTDLSVNHEKDALISNEWFEIHKNNFEFQYDKNVFDLVFKVSNHPYPNKLLYSYQVIGLDTIWSEFTSSPKLYLKYIPVGTYNVNVKIKDLSTGSISLTKLAAITILPPFWKTWWFISAIVSIGAFIIILAYIKRINYIKESERQKAETQKRILEMKLEALQSQMNPHFTYNAMNSIQNFIIDNDIDNALMYMGEFAKLIRKTLDNSTQRLISLSEEISYLKSYILLENMRFNNKVLVSIKYEHIDPSLIMVPPMLIQPFVENVFVHAFSKETKVPKLDILFFIKNNNLFCEIKDNGKGISKTTSGQLHESKGLNLVRERLKLINGKSINPITITSKDNMGTTVLLQLEKVESNS